MLHFPVHLILFKYACFICVPTKVQPQSSVISHEAHCNCSAAVHPN